MLNALLAFRRACFFVTAVCTWPLFDAVADEANVTSSKNPVFAIRGRGQVDAPIELAIAYTNEQHCRPKNWIKQFDVPEMPAVGHSLDLTGTLRIAKFDPSGRPAQMSLVLQKLDIDDHGDEDHAAKIDQRHHSIGIELNHELKYEVVKHDFEIGPTHKEMLCRAMELALCLFPGERYDAEYGHRTGDRWPISIDDNFVKQISPQNFEGKSEIQRFAEREAITGSVALLSRNDLSGVDCFELLATTSGVDCFGKFTIDKHGDINTGVGDEQRILSVNVHEELRFLVPADPQSLFSRIRGMRKTSYASESLAENAKGLQCELETCERFNVKMTPIKRWSGQ